MHSCSGNDILGSGYMDKSRFMPIGPIKTNRQMIALFVEESLTLKPPLKANHREY